MSVARSILNHQSTSQSARTFSHLKPSPPVDITVRIRVATRKASDQQIVTTASTGSESPPWPAAPDSLPRHPSYQRGHPLCPAPQLPHAPLLPENLHSTATASDSQQHHGDDARNISHGRSARPTKSTATASNDPPAYESSTTWSNRSSAMHQCWQSSSHPGALTNIDPSHDSSPQSRQSREDPPHDSSYQSSRSRGPAHDSLSQSSQPRALSHDSSPQSSRSREPPHNSSSQSSRSRGPSPRPRKRTALQQNSERDKARARTEALDHIDSQNSRAARFQANADRRDTDNASTSTSGSSGDRSTMSAPAVLHEFPFLWGDAAPAEAVYTKHWPPADAALMHAVKRALHWKPREQTVPIFDFQMTIRASRKNYQTLREANFNLEYLLLHDSTSPLRPGSEFRPVGLLSPIFKGHPFWKRMKSTLLVGAEMPLEPISEADRKKIVDAALEYGNHKSAQKNGPAVMSILQKEVAKGWQLPLPVTKLHRIPGVIVGPMGLVSQTTIDEHGNTIPKHRLTHDQSFNYDLENVKSVNERVNKALLSQCVYGFALKRFLHSIVALRTMYGNTPLLMTKFDFKSAYRRVHFRASSALQSVVTTTGLESAPLALMSLRETFGGAPCPFLFAEFSEPVADLANALARCQIWNPAATHSPHRNLMGPPKLSVTTIPFAPARPMLVDPETDEFGTTEVFIDDLIGVFPWLSQPHLERCSNSTLLALELVSRPLGKKEPLPRDAMLALDKAIAEGTPAETQTMLGWQIDTRRMLIQLPNEKFENWTSDLRATIDLANRGQRIHHKDLETLIGRLQHTAVIVQEGNHFLNRLRSADRHAQSQRHQSTRLTREARLDLELWCNLLRTAWEGISINRAVSRAPDWMVRTDACEYGLGGYSLTTGRAWRWEIPPPLRLLKSINFLEYLACITGILLSILEDGPNPDDCYLSIGDNTSSLGWLRKSNFAADHEQASHSGLARYFAITMADAKLCQFSQWFPGKENDIADRLSREHVWPDEFLTKYTLLLDPSYKQVPPTFECSPLPPVIISILDYWVRHKLGSTESPPPLIARDAPTGGTSSSFCTSATSRGTHTSRPSPRTNATSSLEPSPMPYAAKSFPKAHMETLTWLQVHARPPSTTYARPSSQRVDPIHPWTRTEKLRSFYNVSTEATGITIQQPSSKSRFHSSSSV